MPTGTLDSEPARAAVGCEDTCNAATCCPGREVPSSCLCLWGPSSSFQGAFPSVLSAREGGCLEHPLHPLTLLLLWLLRAAPTACGGRSRSLRGSSHHVQALGNEKPLSDCSGARKLHTQIATAVPDPRGLQPWCLEGALSSQKPRGSPSPSSPSLQCGWKEGPRDRVELTEIVCAEPR